MEQSSCLIANDLFELILMFFPTHTLLERRYNLQGTIVQEAGDSETGRALLIPLANASHLHWPRTVKHVLLAQHQCRHLHQHCSASHAPGESFLCQPSLAEQSGLKSGVRLLGYIQNPAPVPRP